MVEFLGLCASAGLMSSSCDPSVFVYARLYLSGGHRVAYVGHTKHLLASWREHARGEKPTTAPWENTRTLPLILSSWTSGEEGKAARRMAIAAVAEFPGWVLLNRRLPGVLQSIAGIAATRWPEGSDAELRAVWEALTAAGAPLSRPDLDAATGLGKMKVSRAVKVLRLRKLLEPVDGEWPQRFAALSLPGEGGDSGA